MCLRSLIMTLMAVVAVVRSRLHDTTLFRVDCENVSNATWPQMSASVDLLPAGEIRAHVADRKHVAVHVIVDVGKVAPPRGRTANCDGASGNGCFRGFCDSLHTAFGGWVDCDETYTDGSGIFTFFRLCKKSCRICIHLRSPLTNVLSLFGTVFQLRVSTFSRLPD